jgi:hypothetical protein
VRRIGKSTVRGVSFYFIHDMLYSNITISYLQNAKGYSKIYSYIAF